MTPTLILMTYGLAALLIGLVAGVFLAFSDFIMRSLAAVSTQAGVEAMQQINRKVFGSVFLAWLLGMAPVSAGLAGYAWLWIDGPAAGWFIGGGVIFVLGVLGVTMLGNVPMNNRLDTMAPAGAETAEYWSIYATFWTQWNHVRTAASIASAAAFMIGCVLYA